MLDVVHDLEEFGMHVANQRLSKPLQHQWGHIAWARAEQLLLVHAQWPKQPMGWWDGRGEAGVCHPLGIMKNK